MGNNTLQGGNGGIDTYNMGTGHDTIVASTGAYDRVIYSSSPAANVINLDNVSHTFTNLQGVSRTVTAYSGSAWSTSTADQNAYSNGDAYTAVSGTGTSIEQVNMSALGDIVFGGSTGIALYTTGATDYFIGGSGNDAVNVTRGFDRFDGGGGTNYLTANTPATTGDMFVYFDRTSDINNNGIADYIDKGINASAFTSTITGLSYTGFISNINNVAVGTSLTVFKNFTNYIGYIGNETVVGDGNANEINARTGTNTIYGMGGNDTITILEGVNTVDGGSGTDTLNFQSNFSLGSSSGTPSQGISAFLADSNFNAASDKNALWGTSNSTFNVRTGITGAFVFSTVTNMEDIRGTDFDDVLYGSSSANTIIGNNGNDTIAGNGGADTLQGGNGNDTFLVKSTDLATVVSFDGGANTDTVISAGYTFTVNTISNSQFVSIEAFDVRNSVNGTAYSLSANDIRKMADLSNASVLSFKIDSGDTFTPTVGASAGALSTVQTLNTATDKTWLYYSSLTLQDAAHLVATLNVLYGA